MLELKALKGKLKVKNCFRASDLNLIIISRYRPVSGCCDEGSLHLFKGHFDCWLVNVRCLVRLLKLCSFQQPGTDLQTAFLD